MLMLEHEYNAKHFPEKGPGFFDPPLDFTDRGDRLPVRSISELPPHRANRVWAEFVKRAYEAERRLKGDA
jgi:hypothetical protein